MIVRRKGDVEPDFMRHCAAFPYLDRPGFDMAIQVGAYYDVALRMFIVFHAGECLQDTKLIGGRKGERGTGLYCGWSLEYYKSHPSYHHRPLNTYASPIFPWCTGKSIYTVESGGQLVYDSHDRRYGFHPLGYRSYMDTFEWLYGQYQIINLKYYEEV